MEDMVYELNLDTWVLSSSDGCRATIGETDRRTILEMIEPVPGATYRMTLGEEIHDVPTWREFMKLLDVVI